MTHNKWQKCHITIINKFKCVLESRELCTLWLSKLDWVKVDIK